MNRQAVQAPNPSRHIMPSSAMANSMAPVPMAVG